MGRLVKNRLGFSPDTFVFQDKAMFNYSIDTVLLGNFATVSINTKRFLEIGTNNGALAIFLAQRYDAMHIDAIEIQTAATKLAMRNVTMNNLDDRILVQTADFNAFWETHNQQNAKRYDAIICNPPFYKVNTGHMRKGNVAMHLATHEITLTLEQVIKGASKIIRQKGYLSLVLPTERTVDCFELMRKYGFEPKRVQFVYPRINDKSNLVLVEARFRTGWGTLFLPNLYLHSEAMDDSAYRSEVVALYKPQKFMKEIS